uniref:DCD domain-containing protein n=1 Tax=Kalanchoe fedtschenkoi TaxID=63787 RepID=A0A7N0ZWE6_KALFE
MVKGGKAEYNDSEKPTQQIIAKGIGKKNGKGKKLKAVTMGVESLASDTTGSNAYNKDISEFNDEFAGYIFLCSGRTKPECFSYRVFGLPSFRINVVAKIKQNTKLFLFDFDVKLLYGVYAASSDGTMNLEPHAFDGKFPAQVKFEIFKECMAIPESKFKHAIKHNYFGRSKFKQDLSADQVNNLISLFPPLSSPLSAPRVPLLSNKLQPVRTLHQEIEEQIHPPGISPPMHQQLAGSQYIGSGVAHSSSQASRSSLPLYDYEGLMTSMHGAHVLPVVPSRHFPLNRLLPNDSSHLPEHPQRSFFPQCSAPNHQGISASMQMYGPFHSGVDINHQRGLPNEYYLNQNQDIRLRQSHGQAQTTPQISAPPRESDRTPSSVLAAAYWVAVASEIPQPGVPQSVDSVHNMTGQNTSSLQYKPPNLTSASILDAYWEAKALEDSRQMQPGPSHMLGPNPPNSQIFAESAQGPSQSMSVPYWVAVSNGDQYHLNSNQQPMLSSQGIAFPNSHTAGDAGNQVPTFDPGPQQPVYDPAHPQIQHSAPPPYGALNL